MVNLLSTLLIALFITIVMIPFFRGLAYKVNAVDVPDERKVHIHPMARTGGLAMAVGTLVPLILWSPPDPFLRVLLLAVSIIVGAGFIDDLVNLGPKTKLGVQLLAAGVITLYGGVKIQYLGALLPEGWLLPDWFSIPLTMIVVTGVTNAINLADGLDGLAGGISIIVFMALGYLSFMVGNPVVTLISAAVVGAIFGFLRFNTYPATIFMGDAGSQMLGFIAVVLAIQLTQNNIALSPVLPFLLLGFPILDTLTVMLARIYHGRSPFSADKNHFHHKLMRLGLYHSEAVLIIYSLQVVLVLTAYKLRYYSDWMILGGYLVVAFLITLFFFLSAHLQWHIRHRPEGEFNLLQKRLAELDKLTLMLKIIFRLLQANFIVVLLIIIIQAPTVPFWLSWTALGLAVILLLSLFIKSSAKRYNLVLRLAVYLTMPVLIYNGAVSEITSVIWWKSSVFYSNTAYFSLILLSLLLLKFTRRSGYKSTPLDFLILGVALFVPVITRQSAVGLSTGMVAVKIIALFFTFEVIVEESRKQNRWLGAAVFGSLLLVGLQGIWLKFLS